MHIPVSWRRVFLLAAMFCLSCPRFVTAADEPTLSKEQITHFLLTAKVVNSTRSSKGVTNPWRLTLSDGNVTHDASFQTIDEHKNEGSLHSAAKLTLWIPTNTISPLTVWLSCSALTTCCQCTWNANGEEIQARLAGGSRCRWTGRSAIDGR
jgi:hypothetical protein